MNNHIKYFVYFTIDYVEDIYQTMVEAIGSKQLDEPMDELKKQTLSPMNTMLNKQPREEAIRKRNTRDKTQLVDVPPTNPGTISIQL